MNGYISESIEGNMIILCISLNSGKSYIVVSFGEFEDRFAIFISITPIFLYKLIHNRNSGLLIDRLIRYNHGP